MGHFELETIEPPSVGGGRGSLSASQLKAIEDAAFSNGYKAGVDAASAGLMAEQNRFLSAIGEILADQQFQVEQANAHAQKGVCTLVEAVGDALAPGVAQTHYRDVVAARVAAAARQCTSGDLTLYLPAEALETIGPLLAPVIGRARLQADEHLSGLQARLEWAGGADRLDMEEALAQMRDLSSEYRNKIKELDDERHRDTG